MTNTTTITAVAEAIMGTLFCTHGFASSQPMTEAAQAAIEAYETAQRSDKEACRSKSADSESQTVREMTVEEVAEIICGATFKNPKELVYESRHSEKKIPLWHTYIKEANALAKLGTIRIVE